MIHDILKRLLLALRRKPATGNWIPEIDGLRFVAILPVVLQHLLERFARATGVAHTEPILDDPAAFFISRGTVGVFLFFAISGFVVAMPFAKHYLEGSPRVGLQRFYGRRLTRIEPPYLIWMTLFALVLLIQGTWTLDALLPHWAASMTYTHSLFYGKYSVINPVAWSLEIEIQFYLLAPALAALYFRISDARRRRILMIGFLTASTCIQYAAGWWFFPIKTTLLGQLQHFLVGFLLLDFYLTDWKKSTASGYRWDITAALAFTTMCYTWTTEFWKNIAFLIALGVLFAAAFKGVLFPKLIRNQWVAVTGGMCYTIYLIHLPILQGITRITTAIQVPGGFWTNFAFQAALLLPLIWLCSAAGYLLLERPFMRFENKIKFNPMTLFMKKYPTFSLVPVLVFMAMGVSTSLGAQEIQPVSGSGDTLRLKPLSILTDMAIRRSPELKANQIDAARQTAMVKVQRRSWTDLVAVGGSMLYGNGTVLDNNQDAVTSKYLLTDRKSLGTNVSVSIRLSGGDIVNRGQKTEIQRLQLERIQFEREGMEEQIRLEIISLYNQLELSVKMVQSKAEAVENQRMAASIAEKYFKEGNFSAAEYSTLLSKVSTARDQFIQAQSETKRYALLLRERCGGDIWEH
jgi:peptidoglycan/LPS O-acetylase OafA/YrhL